MENPVISININITKDGVEGAGDILWMLVRALKQTADIGDDDDADMDDEPGEDDDAGLDEE